MHVGTAITEGKGLNRMGKPGVELVQQKVRKDSVIEIRTRFKWRSAQM